MLSRSVIGMIQTAGFRRKLRQLWHAWPTTIEWDGRVSYAEAGLGLHVAAVDVILWPSLSTNLARLLTALTLLTAIASAGLLGILLAPWTLPILDSRFYGRTFTPEQLVRATHRTLLLLGGGLLSIGIVLLHVAWRGGVLPLGEQILPTTLVAGRGNKYRPDDRAGRDAYSDICIESVYD
eukprot:SAG31_NODE_4128_length_3557_cov_1.191440_7_plen_180_part_00